MGFLLARLGASMVMAFYESMTLDFEAYSHTPGGTYTRTESKAKAPMRYRWLLRSAVVIQLGPTGRKVASSGDRHQNDFQNRDTRLRAGMSS